MYDELIHYKETLRRMYMLYMDQDRFVNELKLNNTNLVVGIDHHSNKTIDLMVQFTNIGLVF